MSENIALESVQIGAELAELCHLHGIDPARIRDSRDLDQLLGGVLDDCGRLVEFARKASALRARTEESPALVSSIGDLERLRNGVAADGDHDENGRAERCVELLSDVSQLCHRINNPLTSLMGRAQILQMKKDTGPAEVHKAAEVIEESARRVAELVQELGQRAYRGREELLSK